MNISKQLSSRIYQKIGLIEYLLFILFYKGKQYRWFEFYFYSSIFNYFIS